MEQERLDECEIGLGLGLGLPVGGRDHKLHVLFPPRPPTEEEEEEEEDSRRNQSKRSKPVNGDGQDDRRKKLRLTQRQATMLEDTFREHHTLSTHQKQDLAEKLDLRPRQVEVWFQNRRARNKLKQTEVDFQLLKKWCENLEEDNRRLKKELQELRLMKHAPEVSSAALYLDLPKVGSGAVALTLCPSCGRTTMAGGGGGKKSSASGDSSICSTKE